MCMCQHCLHHFLQAKLPETILAVGEAAKRTASRLLKLPCLRSRARRWRELKSETHLMGSV